MTYNFEKWLKAFAALSVLKSRLEGINYDFQPLDEAMAGLKDFKDSFEAMLLAETTAQRAMSELKASQADVVTLLQERDGLRLQVKSQSEKIDAQRQSVARAVDQAYQLKQELQSQHWTDARLQNELRQQEDQLRREYERKHSQLQEQLEQRLASRLRQAISSTLQHFARFVEDHGVYFSRSLEQDSWDPEHFVMVGPPRIKQLIKLFIHDYPSGVEEEEEPEVVPEPPPETPPTLKPREQQILNYLQEQTDGAVNSIRELARALHFATSSAIDAVHKLQDAGMVDCQRKGRRDRIKLRN